MSFLEKLKNLWPFNSSPKMKAIGFEQALPLDAPNVLLKRWWLGPNQGQRKF
ncbi:Protein of unknown function [Leuconostoc citreum LBAE C11]|nr:Protein of unknown function [Leuconostoc citreum LBAE C11]